MKAVTFKWQSLSKEQKHPFETASFDDKQRYEKELIDFKKGLFNGRYQSTLVKLQNDSDMVNQALEITDDLMSFLQVKIQQQQIGALKHDGNSDIDELQAQEDAMLADYEKQLEKDNNQSNLKIDSFEDQQHKSVKHLGIKIEVEDQLGGNSQIGVSHL